MAEPEADRTRNRAERAAPREATPPDVGGTLTVASLNVLHYLSTIDTGAWICGPSGDMECRGADSAVEFGRQRAKIISAIAGMDADIVGLMEMENNPGAAIHDLVNGLNWALSQFVIRFLGVQKSPGPFPRGSEEREEQPLKKVAEN